MIDRLLAIIAPHRCYGCGDEGAILCDCCKNDIFETPFTTCVVCREPTAQDNLCSRHTLPYTRLWCVAKREGVLEAVIDGYKFRRVRAAADVLAELLDTSLPDLGPNVVVVPVPTAPRNVRIRGYDHMVLVARALAKRRGWRVSPLLKRQTNATQHFAKTAVVRRKQAKHFFVVHGTIAPDVPYLVIDDIFTTGSTIEAAADCLKRAGAAEVWIGVIARQ
jgi:ComF family protein